MAINGITFDLRTIKAVDFGVVPSLVADGILKGCAMTSSGLDLTIAKGYFMLAGRLIQLDADHTLACPYSGDGTVYLTFKIDTSIAASGSTFTQGDFVWYDSAPSLTQEDLYATGTTYEALIATCTISTGAISAVTENIEQLNYLSNGLLITGLSLPTTGYSSLAVNVTATGVSTDSSKVYQFIPVWSEVAATRANEKVAWNLIDTIEVSATNTLTITVSSEPLTAVTFIVKEVV